MPITKKNDIFIAYESSSTRRVRSKSKLVKLVAVTSACGTTGSSNGTRAELGVANACPERVDSVDIDNTKSTKRQKLEENWADVLSHLVCVGLSLEVPISNICTKCGNEIQNPVRCLDCSTYSCWCEQCEKEIHVGILHKPEIWKGHMFIPHVTQQCWKRWYHSCSTSYDYSMQLFDYKGREHSITMQFCDCETRAASLIRYGFWPATPMRPAVAFSVQLLKLLNMLTLECSVSVAGFVQTLRWMNHLTCKEANHLYRMLIGDSVSQFRNYEHHMTVTGMTSSDGLNKCPVCPKEGGTVTICMDANFGLVRKKHSGTSSIPPSMSSGYFLNTDDVNEYILSYINDGVKDKDCHSFLAGDAVRSRARNSKLDVRGIFGSVCRHEYPVLFMDMKHGERLAYPVLLLSKIRDMYSGDTRIQGIYDIACILTRHLKKTNNESLLDRFQLALPVFHAYGHNASCQIDFSARNLTGFGLTDGEGTERLWSYMRPLAKITKEMTPSRRLDLLNHALVHFSRRKTCGLALTDVKPIQTKTAKIKILLHLIVHLQPPRVSFTLKQLTLFDLPIEWGEAELDSNVYELPVRGPPVFIEHSRTAALGQWFEMRVRKADAVIKDCEEKLIAIQTQFHVSLDEIANWTDSFKAQMCSKFTSKRSGCGRKQMLAVLLNCSAERAYLVSLLSKYCDGQSVATRISRQVNRATKLIRTHVEAYHTKEQESGCPTIFTFEEAIDTSNDAYLSALSEIQFDSCAIPSTTRWTGINLNQLQKRACEEKIRIGEDMTSAIQHFCNLHGVLTNSINAACSLSVQALLSKKMFHLETLMADIWHVCSKYIENLTAMPGKMFQDIDASYLDDENVLDLDDIILKDADDIDEMDSLEDEYSVCN